LAQHEADLHGVDPDLAGTLARGCGCQAPLRRGAELRRAARAGGPGTSASRRSGPRARRGERVTDDLGARTRAAGDRTWHQVPEPVRRTVRAATSVEQVVDAMVDDASPWAAELQRHLLHPASGGPAVLVPRTRGRALVLGGERHALAPALRFLGLDVTRADWVGDRLRFQQLAHPVSGAP